MDNSRIMQIFVLGKVSYAWKRREAKKATILWSYVFGAIDWFEI